MPPPGGPPGATPPAAPQEAIAEAGLYARARTQMLACAKALSAALQHLPQGSEEQEACLGALKALSTIEQDVAPGLLASEAQALAGGAQAVPGGGGGGMTMRGPQPMLLGPSGSYGA